MPVIVLMIAKDKSQAHEIARALLEKKLVACVNIIDSVQSLFWWKDKIDQAHEALLVCKTTKECLAPLEELVKSIHTYEVPEILALPVEWGNEEYLDWVKQSTLSPKSD